MTKKPSTKKIDTIFKAPIDAGKIGSINRPSRKVSRTRDYKAIDVTDGLASTTVDTKQLYGFRSYNLLMLLWSQHFVTSKEGNGNAILYSFTGSYDISDTKKSLLTISTMFTRKFIAQPIPLNRFDYSMLNKTLSKEFQNFNSVSQFLMFTPRNIVRIFRLNVVNNKIDQKKAVVCKIKYGPDNELVISKDNYDKTLEKIISEEDKNIYTDLKYGRLEYADGSSNNKYKAYVEEPDKKMVYFRLSNFKFIRRNMVNFRAAPKLFSSKNQWVYIPYFQDYNDMDDVKKLLYYYKSKWKALDIIAMEGKCAEQLYDEFYCSLLENIPADTLELLFPKYNDYKIFMHDGKINGEDFARVWKNQYRQSRKVLKMVDDKYKHIANEYSKQRFTYLYNAYRKTTILPLNTTLAFFRV